MSLEMLFADLSDMAIDHNPFGNWIQGSKRKEKNKPQIMCLYVHIDTRETHT